MGSAPARLTHLGQVHYHRKMGPHLRWHQRPACSLTKQIPHVNASNNSSHVNASNSERRGWCLRRAAQQYTACWQPAKRCDCGESPDCTYLGANPVIATTVTAILAGKSCGGGDFVLPFPLAVPSLDLAGAPLMLEPTRTMTCQNRAQSGRG